MFGKKKPAPQCGKSITKMNIDGTFYYSWCLRSRDHKGKCF